MHRALGAVAWRASRPSRACTSGASMQRGFSAAAAAHPHGPADPYDVVVFGGGMVGVVLAALLGALQQLPASLQSAHLSSCAVVCMHRSSLTRMAAVCCLWQQDAFPYMQGRIR